MASVVKVSVVFGAYHAEGSAQISNCLREKVKPDLQKCLKVFSLPCFECLVVSLILPSTPVPIFPDPMKVTDLREEQVIIVCFTTTRVHIPRVSSINSLCDSPKQGGKKAMRPYNSENVAPTQEMIFLSNKSI